MQEIKIGYTLEEKKQIQTGIILNSKIKSSKDKDFVYYEDKKLKVSPNDSLFVNRNVTNKSLPDINVGYGFLCKRFSECLLCENR